MKQWTFRIAWLEDTPGAGGEETKIHQQFDLIALPEDAIYTEWTFEAESAIHALYHGRSCAFLEDWMSQDSVSVLLVEGKILDED